MSYGSADTLGWKLGRTTGYQSRQVVVVFHFVAWHCLSLGIHISLAVPNIEIHVPFGFFRLGRQYCEYRPGGWIYERDHETAAEREYREYETQQIREWLDRLASGQARSGDEQQQRYG